MDIDLTISGYRCFSPSMPIRLALRDDIVALIGINNAGKSTLLKAFYELRDVFIQLSEPGSPISEALNGRASFKKAPETGDTRELFWHFDRADLMIGVGLPAVKADGKEIWYTEIRVNHNSTTFSVSFTGPLGTRKAGTKYSTLEIADNVQDAGSLDAMFQAFKILANCFYYPSIRYATRYLPEPSGPEPAGKLFDIASGPAFIDRWALWHQGHSKDYTEQIRVLTNSIKKIFKYEDLEIISQANRHELLIVANGKSLRLDELGSGLAQFILMLGNIAFNSPSYILIDEPETNLHPSLQLEFIRLLASYAESGVIFATHTLGLARQGANRVLTMTTDGSASQLIELKDTPNLAQLVGELSFGRADEVGARRLLLVEGTNDIMTFEAFLAAFGCENKFALLSLGGAGNISAARERELEHILAINPNVAAIIDSERRSEHEDLSTERAGFKSTCERMGIACHVLQRCAIENYFTQEAINAAFPSHSYRALLPYEPLATVNPHWPKRRNWRIAQAMKKREIETADLGQILRTLAQL